MTCENEWSVRFPDVSGTGGPVEVVPLSFTFDSNWEEYDLCKLKFSQDVREMFDGNVALPEHEFGKRHIAELRYDGIPRHRLMYDPAEVTFGNNYLHIELLDLHRAMDTGVIDDNFYSLTVQDIYEKVFAVYEEATTTQLIKKLSFTDDLSGPHSTTLPDEEIRARSNYILNTSTWFDFDQVSPATAIEELNENFSFQSWVTPDGVLHIGNREATDRVHVAAPDDERVWRWTDPTIRFAKDRTKAVLVEGSWFDDPRIGKQEDNVRAIFSNLEPAGQVRVQGMAWRPNVEEGETVVITQDGVNSDNAAEIAENHLKHEDARLTGSIGINPQASGRFTHPSSVYVGDFLHVIPDDDHFMSPRKTTGSVLRNDTLTHNADSDCKPGVNNVVLRISGVRHRVDQSGRWNIELNVDYYRFEDYDPIKSTVRYFDPTEDEMLEESDLFEGIFEGFLSSSTIEDFLD